MPLCNNFVQLPLEKVLCSFLPLLYSSVHLLEKQDNAVSLDVGSIMEGEDQCF